MSTVVLKGFVCSVSGESTGKQRISVLVNNQIVRFTVAAGTITSTSNINVEYDDDMCRYSLLP